MALHRFRKGLDLPISGQPRQEVAGTIHPARVALVAADYVGMKPTFRVEAGDTVKRGQVLFEDKKAPGVLYTAPGAGEVVAINRGHRRALESVVIELSESERAGEPGEDELERFGDIAGKKPADLGREAVRDALLKSGLWTALRERPFSRVPQADSEPHSIFVTAIDTNPLAPDVAKVLEGREADFQTGLRALLALSDAPVYLCKSPHTKIDAPGDDRLRVEEFDGPHPAGLAGLHIQTLDPVHREKSVWHIGYQETAAMGALFRTGTLDVTRVIALAGPVVKEPRLVETRVGASTDDLTRDALTDMDSRVISGSVLSGRTAIGEVRGFLGLRHNQVSALHEGKEREFIGWMLPGAGKFSAVRDFVSGFLPKRLFDMTTSTGGSHRAMLPIGQYESVMPMDIEATFLLRALMSGDIETAIALGCLELDEEDLALCTFVCPGKNDFGPALREMLTTIEKEG